MVLLSVINSFCNIFSSLTIFSRSYKKPYMVRSGVVSFSCFKIDTMKSKGMVIAVLVYSAMIRSLSR